MSRVVVGQVAAFTPRDGDWRRLDTLIRDLARHDFVAEDFSRLFRLFERFPEDDGAEVFWGIVHLLEDVGGYEAALVSSLRRAPSEMGAIMINRMINGGIRVAAGTPCVEILAEIADNPGASESVRQRALRFIDYQNRKTQ